MNSGDKVWWTANGGKMALPTVDQTSPDAALFAGVKLPLQPANAANAQAQVITTKTIVIYGTGRNGGTPDANDMYAIYAVDKATGKEVGAVAIPTRTSAVPMTFMHKGKQYIVYATGIRASTALVALALPGK